MSTADEIEKLRAENQRLRKENSDLRAVVEDLLRFQAGEHPETWEGILEASQTVSQTGRRGLVVVCVQSIPAENLR